ncbi:MAG: APC family permease [Candidatus Aenigmatarchaeota archaeon]
MKLKKELNIFYLVFLGLSNIIGAGIFVVSGIATSIAGPSVIFSFLIAGIAASLIGMTIAELSSAIHETGESYTYTKKAFGKFLGFLVGWMRFLNYPLSISAVSISFSSYLLAFFLPNFYNYAYVRIVSLLIIVFSTVLNIVGTRSALKIATSLTLFKLFSLTFFIIFGIFYAIKNFDANKINIIFPNGFSGMLQAASLVFFAYLGFQAIAMASEESDKPSKDIPLAITLSIFISSVFYILVALVEVLNVHWSEFKNVNHAILYTAQKISTNQYFLLLITISALASMGSVILATLYSGSRLTFAIARDNLFPSFLSKISKRFYTPTNSIIAISLISAIFVFSPSLSFLISIVNFTYLFSFIFSSLSLIKLRSKINPKFKLPFHPLVPLLTIAISLLLILASEITSIIVSLFALAIGVLIYFLKKKIS